MISQLETCGCEFKVNPSCLYCGKLGRRMQKYISQWTMAKLDAIDERAEPPADPAIIGVALKPHHAAGKRLFATRLSDGFWWMGARGNE